ncbi:MAG: GNAT family N-acetyltransferase [Candidatus Thermoplasmatota archaeon]|nr:GNAT family N-acetyltransferase [Candidatus Thermoplasmatota archaeon]MCL5731089.1 GNAT family N-acetyltransferase [Candidatus Thermoplasmatota archaeon]
MVVRNNEEFQQSIHHFIPDYIAEVTDLANRSMTESYDHKVIMDAYRNWPEGFLMGLHGRTLTGFIAGSKFMRTEARILLLAVDEKYRRLGIGSALISRFMEICRQNGFMSIRLEVRTDNTAAISFYRNHGFSITATMPYYYSDLSDAFQMWRLL